MRSWTLIVWLALVQFSPAIAKKSETLSGKMLGAVDAALVKSPQDGEVCFSPEEPCDIKLIKFIESAQKSLEIAIYDINLDQLVHQLLLASKKIPVRIVVDRRQSKGSHSLVPLLVKAGAQVRFGRQRGIMHNKFTIVDGGMVETGSFNYTNHATKANNENQIYLSSRTVLERYRARFEEIWKAALPAGAVEVSARPGEEGRGSND